MTESGNSSYKNTTVMFQLLVEENTKSLQEKKFTQLATYHSKTTKTGFLCCRVELS